MACTELRPSGAGSRSEFSPLTGSNWQNVAETVNPDDDGAHDGDVSYNSTALASRTDSFSFTHSIPANAIIHSISVFTWAKSILLNGRMRVAVIVGGTVFSGRATAIDTDRYYKVWETWLTNPATGQRWALADLDSLEIAYQTNNLSRTHRVTQVYGQVHWELT